MFKLKLEELGHQVKDDDKFISPTKTKNAKGDFKKLEGIIDNAG